MGNPSDQFGGKSIALSIKNFWAEVTITASSKLVSVLYNETEFRISVVLTITKNPFSKTL